jgi:hypothetical protein
MSNLLQYSKMVERKRQLVSHAKFMEKSRMLEEEIRELKLEDAVLKQRISKLEKESNMKSEG